MQTEIDPRDLIGHKAVDRNGDKIGTVDEVYLDDATGRPEWAAVRTGLFGRDAFVPLATSEFISDELRVPFEKSQVKDSPDFGVGQHLSPEQELQLYRYYGLEVPAGPASGSGNATNGHAANGKADGAGSTDKALDSTAAQPVVGAAAPAVATTAAAATMAATTRPADSRPADSSRTAAFVNPSAQSTGQNPAVVPAAAAATTPSLAKPEPRPAPLGDPLTDPLPDPLTGPLSGTAAAGTGLAGTAAASGTAGDPFGKGVPVGDPGQAGVPEPIEFVCREERLDISTEWRVLGRARLRKYVTAEQVERRVPVIRERIRVERVPVGADERAQLTDQAISESNEEVTLHEQRVVVRKTVVPVERIRLVTERYTEEEVVRDELHREHIQVQDSTRPTGPTSVPGTGQPAPAPQGSQSPQPQSRPDLPNLPGHAIGA